MAFKTAAFLGGAAQGLNVLGQGMLRQVERDADESMQERRAQMLARIQRENAAADRKAQAEFDDERAPVLLARRQAEAEALGKTATKIETDRLSDPAFQAARRTQADADAEAATKRDIAAALKKLNDPELSAVERRKAQEKLDDLQKEVKIRGDEAIRVARATRAPSQGSKSISQQLKEKEDALGRPLTQAEREALVIGKQGGDPAFAMRQKEAEDAATKAIETGAIKPEGRAAFVRAQLDSYSEFDAKAQMAELLRTERGAGNVGNFIDNMRRQGADDATLLKMGVTKDELKQSTAAKGGAASQKRGSEPARAPQDVIGNQPIGMLTRQADIEESARAGNKRAIEYLQRQRGAREQDRNAPRDAASMMNG
jgi:hypothetical protein